MKDLIDDISDKLNEKSYQNEEHIRLSLVCRLLQHLGWDIWNPQEVFTEFPAAKDEKVKKADIALCLKPNLPSIYIEIKAHEKLEAERTKTERQLRDYMNVITPIYGIITDGQEWRFYNHKKNGEISEKCFHKIDLIKDGITHLEESFINLLQRERVNNGHAEKIAEVYYEISKRQSILTNYVDEAKKRMDIKPYPNLPQALLACVNEKGNQYSEKDIADYLDNNRNAVSENGKFPQQPIQQNQPKQTIKSEKIKNNESINRPKKSPTPSKREWIKKIPSLRNIEGLNTWNDICNHLGIVIDGDSGRRKLKVWVELNKPSWEPVPEPKKN